MKKINYLAFIIFTVLAISLTACENDEMEPDPNYDGRTDIAIKWKAEAFEVTDAGQTPAGSYEVTIKKSETNENEVILTNFHNWGQTTEAVANLTSNTLTFNTQTISGYNLTGSGTVSDNKQKIDFDYTLDDGFEQLHYIVTFSADAVVKKGI